MVFRKGNGSLPEQERLMRHRFREHRANARNRNVSFELTYDQWKTMWLESGHWDERGPRVGQYVMARFGDEGPYALGNVEIILCTENHSAPTKGVKISRSLRGRKKPTVSVHNKNRVWSSESIEKCRIARENYWSKRKQRRADMDSRS